MLAETERAKFGSMSGNDLKVFNNQPAPAPVCGQSGQRRKFANEMIRSSDIFAISSTADLQEPEAFLSQGNSDCIEMPKYRQQQAKSKKGKCCKNLAKMGNIRPIPDKRSVEI